ncbi:MAG: acyltransferase [Hyphomicrobiales bacterium]|nr:acyltransferase [Hyphomicrobiales bacterium]
MPVAGTLTPTASSLIDAARGLAALVVVFGHIMNFTADAAGHPAAYEPLRFAMGTIVHQAVVAFFVLSGYLVGGAVIQKARSGETFLAKYLIDRVLRIELVLVPALVLTACLDTIGMRFFGSSHVYETLDLARRHDIGTFLLNILNLQNLFTDTFGADTPLWSLSCEFWYYMAAGFAAAGLSRAPLARPARYGLLAVALGIVFVISGPPSFFLFGFIIWGAGAAARALPGLPTPGLRAALLLYGASVIAAAVWTTVTRLPEFQVSPTADLMGAVGFVVLLSAAQRAGEEAPPPRPLTAPAFGFLSKISYSLYATHFPALTLVAAATWGHAPWLVGVIGLPLALVIAILFERLFEARTPALRLAARSLLRLRKAPAAASV